jgi:hypothetical protein
MYFYFTHTPEFVAQLLLILQYILYGQGIEVRFHYKARGFSPYEHQEVSPVSVKRLGRVAEN